MNAHPYYGVPPQAHQRHVWSCRFCKANPRRFALCEAYQRIDDDFYNQHVMDGGSRERSHSAIKRVEPARILPTADEGTDLVERS